MLLPFAYIQTPEGFQKIKGEIEQSPIVGIDTEFERLQTYWPVLCLFQIVTSQKIFVLEPSVLDLSWLGALLKNEMVTKVFHACRQDIEALFVFCGVFPQNIFDTQIAATLVGYKDQLGYADVCSLLLNVPVSKAFHWTTWSKRPLLGEQLHYAAEDVRYLIPLYHELSFRLKEKKRQDLMKNIMQTYETWVSCGKDSRYYFMNKVYDRTMSSTQAHVAYRLTVWREQACQQRNVLRRGVLDDTTLRKLAFASSFDDLLSEHPLREQVFQILQEARQEQGVPLCIELPRIGLAIKAMQDKIKKILTQQQIPSHYVVSQNMIVDFLLSSDPETALLFQGWRKEILSSCYSKALSIRRKVQAQHAC